MVGAVIYGVHRRMIWSERTGKQRVEHKVVPVDLTVLYPLRIFVHLKASCAQKPAKPNGFLHGRLVMRDRDHGDPAIFLMIEREEARLIPEKGD